MNKIKIIIIDVLRRLSKRLKKYPSVYAVAIYCVTLLRRFRRFVRTGNNPLKFKVSDKRRQYEETYNFSRNVKISILVPLFNTPIDFLKQMIDSVQSQTYSNWQLCLADGSDDNHSYVGGFCSELSARDDRITYKKLEKNSGISENTNECIKLAIGEYIALLDHDDLLHPSALFEVAVAICEQEADFVYTDECTFTKRTTNIISHNFKPDFSPDTLRSYNYICHLSVFSKQLLDDVGYYNSEFDGSQDYDLILRLTEKAEKIVHIAKCLYFWRAHAKSVALDVSAKPYVVDAAKRAIAAHLERLGLIGTVQESVMPTTYEIKYEIIGNPLISIIIPNKDHIDDLKKCVDSIYGKSSYTNFEIIIAENNSECEETFNYYKTLTKLHDNVKIVNWEKGFNYSAINNFAVSRAQGQYILLLNNDVEVINTDWLERMLMYAQRSDIGAVGAKLYYPDDTIQHAGVIVGLGGIAGHSHKYFPRTAPGYMCRACIAQNLSACTAACLMVRRDVYNEVNGLDEGYAVAFNDVDFCMKITNVGYRIVFTPYAELYHYESKSRGAEDTPEKQERFKQEIERFRLRWEQQLKNGDPCYNKNLTLDSEDFRLA